MPEVATVRADGDSTNPQGRATNERCAGTNADATADTNSACGNTTRSDTRTTNPTNAADASCSPTGPRITTSSNSACPTADNWPVRISATAIIRAAGQTGTMSP